MHRVDPLETVQGHQESRLEGRSGSDMDPLGHQGHRREDSHRAGTDHEEGSWAAVVADAAGLVDRSLDEPETAVPIVHACVSECIWEKAVQKVVVLREVSEGRQRKISTRFCALGGLKVYIRKVLHHRTIVRRGLGKTHSNDGWVLGHRR
jgi:hypothetical protein